MAKLALIIRKWFLAGLLVIAPLGLTIFVLQLLFSNVDKILGQVVNKYFVEQFGFSVPGTGLILLLILVLFVGALASLATAKVVRYFEDLFLRLPLVNKIYGPLKQIAGFLFAERKTAFKKVVLVEYPLKGTYSIGFITNEEDSIIDKTVGKKLINVFISSSPSPVTGFTIFVPEEELIHMSISVEEAMRLVVSGGMLNPKQL